MRSVEVVPQHVLETAPSPAQLDAFAKSQWEVRIAVSYVSSTCIFFPLYVLFSDHRGMCLFHGPSAHHQSSLLQALLLFLLGPDGGGRRAPAPPGMPRELVRLGLLSPPCLARTRSTTQTAVPPLDIPALLTQAGFLAYQGYAMLHRSWTAPRECTRHYHCSHIKFESIVRGLMCCSWPMHLPTCTLQVAHVHAKGFPLYQHLLPEHSTPLQPLRACASSCSTPTSSSGHCCVSTWVPHCRAPRAASLGQ